MKNLYRTSIAVATLVVLGACASGPTTTSLLDSTRNEYQQAQNNPMVTTYAAVELGQAKAAMDQTNEAADRRDNADKVDNLAYQARQKIALTQEVAKKKKAEADVALAAKERDFIRLNQRTNEANQATAAAQQAQMAAQAAQQDAAEAQRRTAEATASWCRSTCTTPCSASSALATWPGRRVTCRRVASCWAALRAVPR